MQGVFLASLGYAVAWQVRDTGPFQYSFASALLWNEKHICNGALYQTDVALFPATCIVDVRESMEVLIFRYNLSRSSEEDAAAKPSWSPDTGILSDIYTAQVPQRVQIRSLRFDSKIVFLHLDATPSSYIVVSLLYKKKPHSEIIIVGWGGTNTLSHTVRGIYPLEGCSSMMGNAVDPTLELCIQEVPSPRAGFSFKEGSPVIAATKSGPVLIGLLSQQYRTSLGIPVATVLKTGRGLRALASWAPLVDKIAGKGLQIEP